ncbi:PAS domain-containing protein [Salinadaptatus halalkaliphilus]|uniref:PAS domain-containing protein n=1 Tax=Salinadaptatus halalkaliphilus TaxID=2419781 RepID=A0A4S3TQF5_9EURY|nr:PAS domain-containing protein [Salinadaptatus halalkaliphilus]THE66602.1 PAS domain-containing protein [Salinadaptatus halalkaliphilus]
MGITSPRVDDTFFEDVTRVVSECVLSYEDDGAILFTNRAAAELLGYGPGELLESSIDDLVPADQQPTFVRLQRRAVEETAVTTDVTLVREDDREIPVAIAIT